MPRAVTAKIAAALCLALLLFPLAAQDDGAAFGFGESGEVEGGAKKPAIAVKFGGEVGANVSLFVATDNSAADTPFEPDFLTRLNVTAKTSLVEAYIKLKANRLYLTESPIDILNEVYLRFFIGPARLDAGLMKVVWGRADSQGPLDILNPLDLRDLTVVDNLDRKLAVPMLRTVFTLGDFTSLDAVAIIGFKGHKTSWNGRWTPSKMEGLKTIILNPAFMPLPTPMPPLVPPAVPAGFSVSDRDAILREPGGFRISDIQGGLRFSTTMGSVDFGAQYFCGILPRPAYVAMGTETDPYEHLRALYAKGSPLEVIYNRYSQIGFDGAVVLWGFNFRAEAALNVPHEDLFGYHPMVYNPHVGWALGFDRDLGANVMLNIQGTGTVRLFSNNIGNIPGQTVRIPDIEDNSTISNSKITIMLSQKLLKDTLEWELVGMVGIEDKDFLVMPRIAYMIGDGRVDLSGGVFGTFCPDEPLGELGQYWRNSFVRLSCAYKF